MAANNQANIWKFSIFRALGNLFKPSPRTQKCIQISEEGIYRLLNLPMATGWMTDMADQLSWSVIHKLTVRIESTGDNVLFISDRSYIPLDPKSVLNKEEKTRLIPLDEIAATKYNEAFSTCQSRTKLVNAHKLLSTVLYISICFTAIIVLIVLVKGKVGKA